MWNAVASCSVGYVLNLEIIADSEKFILKLLNLSKLKT